MIKIVSGKWFWPTILFVSSLVVYVVGLPSTISFEDSAEFITAAVTLGIPHPSGYPLYVLLGHMFSWLPIGSWPWRVTLLSAVSAAAAVSLSFLIVRQVLRLVIGWDVQRRHLGWLVEGGVALVLWRLAFSEVWWSQAIYAKAYALHACLVLLASYLILSLRDGRWRIIIAALVVGLSLANHLYLAVTMVPFYVVAALMMDVSLRRPSWRWLAALGAGVIGLLPYVYLPWRYAQGAPYAMDRLGSLGDVVAFLARERYSDIGLAAWNKFGLLAVVLWRPMQDLGVLLAVLAVVGIIWLLKRKQSGAWSALILLGGAYLSAAMALTIYSGGWSLEKEYVMRVHGISGIVAVAVLAAIGLAALVERARLMRQFLPIGLLMVSLAGLLFSSATLNWEKMAPWRDGFIETNARATLERLPPGAVLIINDVGVVNDTENFAMAYLQTALGLRRDVTVVSDVGINSFWQPPLSENYVSADLDERRREVLLAVLDEPIFFGRPVYLSYAPDYLSPQWRSRSNGVTFALVLEGRATGVIATEPPPRPMSEPSDDWPWAYRAMVAHADYAYAAQLLDLGDKKAAEEVLIEGINLDQLPFSADFRGFQAHRAATMNQ